MLCLGGLLIFKEKKKVWVWRKGEVGRRTREVEEGEIGVEVYFMKKRIKEKE